MDTILFLLLAFLVSILSATIGFGSALIMIPFSSFFLPIKKAVAIITVFFLAGNLTKIIIFRKYIDWKKTWLIYAGAIPTVIVGALLMVSAPAGLIKKILGIIIILYVMNDYFKISKNIKLSNFSIILVGGVYGFFAGIIGTGSAVKAILLNHLQLRKENFVATMAITAIFLNIIKTGIYSQYNLVTSKDIPLIIGLILCAFSGAYVGKNFVKKLHPETFRRIILFILMVVAIKLILFR